MIHSELHPLRLNADPSRVVVRPFHLAWQGNKSDPGRARRLVDQVLTLSDQEIGRLRRDVEEVLLARRLVVCCGRLEEVADAVSPASEADVSDRSAVAAETRQVRRDHRVSGLRKTRHDLGREAFEKRVWEWKEQSGNAILRPLRRLRG